MKDIEGPVYAKSEIMDLRARAHCLEARAFLVESGGYLHLLESLAPSTFAMRAHLIYSKLK